MIVFINGFVIIIMIIIVSVVTVSLVILVGGRGPRLWIALYVCIPIKTSTIIIRLFACNISTITTISPLFFRNRLHLDRPVFLVNICGKVLARLQRRCDDGGISAQHVQKALDSSSAVRTALLEEGEGRQATQGLFFFILRWYTQYQRNEMGIKAKENIAKMLLAGVKRTEPAHDSSDGGICIKDHPARA